jgi:hypothetical protein
MGPGVVQGYRGTGIVQVHRVREYYMCAGVQ